MRLCNSIHKVFHKKFHFVCSLLQTKSKNFFSMITFIQMGFVSFFVKTNVSFVGFSIDYANVVVMKSLTVVLLSTLLPVSIGVFAADPVKLSNSGICHALGTTYYAQTKNFTPFKTLDECLKSGGRMPKK
jgi:hypothetical protein